MGKWKEFTILDGTQMGVDTSLFQIDSQLTTDVSSTQNMQTIKIDLAQDFLLTSKSINQENEGKFNLGAGETSVQITGYDNSRRYGQIETFKELKDNFSENFSTKLTQ